MRRQALFLIPLVLVAQAACADPSTPSDAPTPASLTVTIALAHGGPVYIEGALRYLHVTGPDVDTQKQLDPDRPVVITLPDGGSYRLESWARPCDGNCGYLDDPMTPCAAKVRVQSDQEVTVRWRVGERCRVA